MLPRDTAKNTVTIYNLWQPEKGLFTYKRTIIHDVIWRIVEDMDSVAQGTKVPEVVQLIFPYGYEYFSVQNGEIYEGEGWTVQIGPEISSSYILKGECEFEFPTLSKDEFVKQSVLPFENQFTFKRPIKVIEKFWGSRGLWQLEVVC